TDGGGTQPEELLEVDDLVAGFGATTVLHGVSLTVRRGEVAGIFGLNGAGKSVCMKVLAGVVPARSGRVRFAGRDITTTSAEERVELGMAHVPQGRQVFGALTVEQNLRLGAYTLRRRDRARYPSVLADVLDRFPILADRREQVAGTMSGGEQASLAVARALMSEPTLVLVDEPSAGLAPLVVEDLFTTLRTVAASGVTMLLVEQNVAFGLQLADTANVMQVGQVVYRGPVADLDPSALAGFLGVGRLLGAGVAASVAGRRPSETPGRRRGQPLVASTRAGNDLGPTNGPPRRAAPPTT
ncbi:MAG TPA: ABC transporter ATP-binding protein, partial [Acidimicrobiales bacterium]|nr:ABC transporter ATP-binding protein [Acidimicrobiales bacterium]